MSEAQDTFLVLNVEIMSSLVRLFHAQVYHLQHFLNFVCALSTLLLSVYGRHHPLGR